MRLRTEAKLKELFSKDRMRLEEIRIAKKDRLEKSNELSALKEKFEELQEEFNQVNQAFSEKETVLKMQKVNNSQLKTELELAQKHLHDVQLPNSYLRD